LKDVQKATSIDRERQDPLGLGALGAAVERLSRIRAEEISEGRRPGRWAACAESLASAWASASAGYDRMVDRHAILKRALADLAGELEWLRDHVDRLASEKAALLDELARSREGAAALAERGGGEGKRAPARRRYTDRLP